MRGIYSSHSLKIPHKSLSFDANNWIVTTSTLSPWGSGVNLHQQCCCGLYAKWVGWVHRMRPYLLLIERQGCISPFSTFLFDYSPRN